MRLDAQEENDAAVLHIDWAEQHKLTEVTEIQSSYFIGRYKYDNYTGYAKTKGKKKFVFADTHLHLNIETV